jgi:hypothetical protein
MAGNRRERGHLTGRLGRWQKSYFRSTWRLAHCADTRWTRKPWRHRLLCAFDARQPDAAAPALPPEGRCLGHSKKKLHRANDAAFATPRCGACPEGNYFPALAARRLVSLILPPSTTPISTLAMVPPLSSRPSISCGLFSAGRD